MKLTPQQIENWRRILFMQLGPYATIMPKEEIIKIRDSMQTAAIAIVNTVNSFFEDNNITDEFDVTDDPVKQSNCNCCKKLNLLHQCTDTNKKTFFLCEDCLSMAEG